MNAVVEPVPALVRLDVGCGPNKREGFTGVDILPFDGKVDVVLNAGVDRWPYDDNSVDEIHSSHFVEHLTAHERIHFVNELCRVLKKGAKAMVITPHWASNRAYGDLTHQWPPISEMWFYYLDSKWRKANAPHCDIEHNPKGYTCDLEATWGYTLHGSIMARNPEYQQQAISFWKEAAQDMIATLTKR